MQWSYPILRVGGTEIHIHLTFLLLLGWIGIAYFRAGGTSAAIDGGPTRAGHRAECRGRSRCSFTHSARSLASPNGCAPGDGK